jgi:GAF domain-containing protein/PAS domain-containing protein
VRHADTSVRAPRLEFSLPFDPARLRRARARIREYLRCLTPDESCVDDVVLCVMEAATNALRHSAGRGEIRIALALHGDELVACVRDDGPGFDPSLLPPEEPPDPLSVGGRGLYLMSRLSDELQFDFSRGCEARLRKRLPVAADTAALPSCASPDWLSNGLDERRIEMMEEADEGFAALDWELRFLHVNGVAESLLHQPRALLLGRSVFEVLPATRGTPYEYELRRALEQGLVARFEEYYAPFRRWHELRVYPASFGVTVHFRDITERRRIENEHGQLLKGVEGQHERLRMVLEHLDEGVFVVDATANVVEANAEARRLGGFADAQRSCRLDEWPEIDFVAGDVPLPRDEWPVARVARGETFFGRELTVRNRTTGEELIALAHGIPVFDEEGALTLGIVSLRDVTAERRSEREKRLQATALRGIADILEAALSAPDPQTLGWECLRVAEEITGSLAGSLAGSDDNGGWSGMVWFHEQECEGDCSEAADPGRAGTEGRNGAMRTLQRIVAARGQALTANPSDEQLLPKADEASRLGAFLGVPLQRGDEVAGVLAVADRPAGYTADELWLLESLAPVVVQVLDRLQTHSTLQESLARTRVLAGVAAAAAGADRAEDVCEAVLVTAALHLGLKAGSVSVLDERAGVLRRLATFGAAYQAPWAREPIPLDDSLNISRMLLRRLPYMTSASTEQTEASLARFASAGLADDSWVKVPVAAGDRVLGACTLIFSGERTFSSEDLSFYRAVADELGVALQRASYADEREAQAAKLRRTAELSRALDAVNAMVRGASEPRLAVAQAAALAAMAIHAERALVHLAEGERWRRLETGGEQAAAAVQAAHAEIADAARSAIEPFAVCFVVAERPPWLGPAHGGDSLFLAPLRAGEEFLGALSFIAPSQKEYDDGEIDFVRKLAAALGGALQNMHLFEALNTQLEVSNLLLTSSRVLNEWTDQETMLARLAGVLLTSAPGCRATVVVADWERQELQVAASQGRTPLSPGPYPLSQLPAVLRERLDDPATLLVDLAEQPDCCFGSADELFRPRFFLAVPVTARGRILGILALEADAERGAFSSQEVAAVEAIAGQAATAMENARLLDAEVEAQRCANRELEISQLLLIMAGIFASQTDPQQLLEHIAHTLTRSFPGARTSITVRDARGDFVVVAAAGENADRIGTGWKLADYSTPARRAMVTGRAVIIDYDTLSGQDAAIARLRNMRVSIFAPLFTKGRTIGVLGIDRAGSRAEFSERELGLAQGIADQAAIAVYIASMFEKEREEVRFHEALDEAGRLLHSALDDDTIFAGALESGVRALRASSGVIATQERSRWVVRYQYGFGNDLIGRGWSAEAVPFVLEAAWRREPFVIDDVQSRRGSRLAGASTPPSVRSVLTVPLLTGADVVGVLIFNKPDVGGFSEAEIVFGGRLGRTVSLALQNARLFAREHTIAETLQEALLAMPDAVPGFDFAHAYHSAALAARVGGDFYDVFELDPGVLGVVVGDISGKGLNAAVLTSAVKNSLRAQAFEQSNTPADVLRLVNEVLVRSTPPEIFATVFYGVLDRGAGRLVYCNAGHTAALLVRAGGEVTELPYTGPIVGAFPNLSYAWAEIAVVPGDLLFLYTDGLVEARHRGALFGPEALLRLFREPALRSPTIAVERVTAAVLAFADGRLSDDMALLAVAPRP